MTNPEPAHRAPSANETVGSLVGEFMEEQRREQSAELARKKPGTRSPLVLPLLAILCLAVWIAPSLMLPRAPVPTVEMLDHGARMTLYLTSLQVRQFHDSTRRLPATLIEAGADTAGIGYTRSTDSVFELSTKVQGTSLTYRSTQPDSVLLGNARLRGVS